jgi:TRAP transporter T-component
MTGLNRVRLALAIPCVVFATVRGQTRSDRDPDALYQGRENLASAERAADLWQQRAGMDFAASWKLARACYWLGTHQAEHIRRAALERGVNAGEDAIRLAGDRPEGHFWLAANMGRLAESFGIVQALRYRGRIREELERALAIDPGWQGGAADAALGEWYATVPRLFGGSRQKAEQHLRRALVHDPRNTSALVFLGQMLLSEGKGDESRGLLLRVVDAPLDPEWAPEDAELKVKAADLLKHMETCRMQSRPCS